MMNLMRNEKGGALLVVLFILLLFTVLGLSIMAYVSQSAKQHTFSEDSIQGKMLADAGLMYFQKYAEQNLSFTGLAKELDGPEGKEEIADILNKIASPMTTDNGPYKQTFLSPLPDGRKQGFAIGYQFVEGGEILLRDGTAGPSQPYVIKLHVSVIGIPARGSNDLSLVQNRVRLDSTIYLNTVPGPFHYAVSTPGELRLLGGSNLIGNVTAHNVVTKGRYRYSEENASTHTPDWKIGPSGAINQVSEKVNLPYLEGTLILSDTETQSGGLFLLDHFPGNEAPDSDPLATESDRITNLGRARLKELFSPRKLDSDNGVDQSRTVLSAPVKEPYIPGYEPPIVDNKKESATPLLLQGKKVSSFIHEQLAAAGHADDDFRVNKNESLHLGESERAKVEDGFRSAKLPTNSRTLVIESQWEKPDNDSDYDTPVPLTARLTGAGFLATDVNQLFIKGKNDRSIAIVEMGRLGSFISSSDKSGDPFSFNGSIYIRGNLDIVGDININGTIFVDGDVLIREISNLDNQNLAIIATGSISLTSRNADKSVSDWKGIKPLSAFLYSEKSLEIYSVASFNRILGGIATGAGDGENPSYIELDTQRENTDLAARLVVQFNRKIFEAPTPGLVSADSFFVDVYDMRYGPGPENVTFESD